MSGPVFCLFLEWSEGARGVLLSMVLVGWAGSCGLSCRGGGGLVSGPRGVGGVLEWSYGEGGGVMRSPEGGGGSDGRSHGGAGVS